MPAKQRGFTLLFMLAAVALVGAALAKIGPMWAQEAQRERETELLRLGSLYAQALQRHRVVSPGSAKTTPKELAALLEDRRFVGTVRHLRKLYPDPMAPNQPWGLLRNADGTIRGVYSTSQEAPLRTEALQLPGLQPLPASAHYADWHFIPVEPHAAQ
jgi:type II secretory pathway pseudopilin PulG